MANLLSIAGVLMVLHAGHSYILLTANMDDLQNVAMQLLKSPITGAMQSVVRRAYNVFTEQLDEDNVKSKGKKHAFDDYANRAGSDISLQDSKNDDQDDEDGPNYRKSKTEGNSRKNTGLLALGRHASVYLKKIKKIFDDVAEETKTKKRYDNSN